MQPQIKHSSPATSQIPKVGRGAITFILATIFMDMLGTAILFPVLPYIVRLYSTDALVVGVLQMIYSAAQFVSAPILGHLSDRYGRRPILLISVFGSALGYYLFGLGGGLWVLVISRLIDGLTGGNLSTAQAYIADVTPPPERAKNFAWMGSVFGLGFIMGPAIGGVLGQFSTTLPAFAAGTFSLLSAIFGYFMLPESLAEQNRTRGPLRLSEANPLVTLSDIIVRPNLGVLLFATFIFNFVYATMGNNFSVYTIEKFGAPPFANAAVFTIVGFFNVIIQAIVVQRLVPRLGLKKLIIAGVALQLLGFLGIVFALSFWELYPICALIGIGNAFMRPTLTAWISTAVSFREQGKVAGVITSLTSLTYVLGPLWAGASYDYIMPSAPYWTGAVLLALTGLLFTRVRPALVMQANDSFPTP